MTSAKKEIQRKINLNKDYTHIWSIDDFNNLSRTSVQKAFSILEKEQFIKRIKRGFYYRPIKTVLGINSFDKHQFAIAKIRNKGSFYCYSGINGYNMLGFTTQMSNTITLASDYKCRNFDNVVYVYRKKVIDGGNAERIVLDLINDIKIIPDTTVENSILHIKELINNKKVNLISLIKTAIDKKIPVETPRAKAVVGAIGEEFNADKKLLEKLKQTINPTTKIFLNIGISLPKAENWNIVEEKGENK